HQRLDLEQQERAEEDRQRIRNAARDRAIAHHRSRGIESRHGPERSKRPISAGAAAIVRPPDPKHAREVRMAAGSKAKKKVGTKKRARAKTAAPAAKKTKVARPESEDSGET